MFNIEKLEQQNHPSAVAAVSMAIGAFSAGYVIGKDLAN